MPVQPPGVWGIDLGQCGLKAIRLQEIDGEVVATAFDYVEHPKILSQPDADPDQLTREALDKFLSRNSLRGDIVAISVPGQSGLARFVKLPPVEEKKIADIVRFEAKQQIPFNLDEVVWDYQKIGSGVVTDGFAMETEIGLFAMKRDMVARYLQHFKDVNVDVHLVQMAPLALCNYVGFDLLAKDAGGEEGADKKHCIVALDIGADSSNLVITDGERIIWQRPIPLGGNHFTRALTKDLKLTFAKAEHLKRNATKSPDLKKILAALKPVLNDFVGEVQRSLGYFTNTHRDAQIQYMVGLGNAFRLPGLQKFLTEKLQIDVRKLTKMERVSGDQVVAQQVYTENILTFAVAYGLALQGLKRARLLTNLLPGEIRVDRLVKAKKPFAVAAAAALLLAIGGLALSYGLEYRTYGDKRVTDAIGVAKKASDAADAANKKFEDVKRQAKEEEEAVKTIVAGQFERDNWPQLLKYINTAVPQPNGDETRVFLVPFDDGTTDKLEIDDIPDTAEAKKYWGKGENNPGRKAYLEYMKQQAEAALGKEGTSANESDELPPGVENLIQFNIEGVDSFYCDNLSNFWDQVKTSGKVRTDGPSMVRPAEDFAKKPEGSGWIIEIRGWTYHHARESFIRATLLENLARLGIQKPKAATPPQDKASPDSAPKTPTPPLTPPAKPGQAPAGETEKLPDLGPVINHISHVVLYEYQNSAPKGAFALLDHAHEQVKTMALASPGASGKEGSGIPGAGMGGGMAGMGGMPQQKPGGMMMGVGAGGAGAGEKTAPTGPSRSEWTPLGSHEVESGTGGMKSMPGMRNRTTGGSVKPGGRGMPGAPSANPSMRPGMGNMRPGTGDPANPAPASDGKRTEFVILFVWKEPTPSDTLRGLTAASQDASSQATGATKPSEDALPASGRPHRPKAEPAQPPSK